MRKLLATAALCLFTLGIVSAKSYSITLPSETKAGAVDLKPGDYTVKIEGNNAVFTNSNGDKSASVPVKVESSDRKFENTSVITTKTGDTDEIKEIDLGGSKTKLSL
jgi:hypothetical protein